MIQQIHTNDASGAVTILAGDQGRQSAVRLRQMHALAKRSTLFPRSIDGEGVHGPDQLDHD